MSKPYVIAIERDAEGRITKDCAASMKLVIEHALEEIGEVMLARLVARKRGQFSSGIDVHFTLRFNIEGE